MKPTSEKRVATRADIDHVREIMDEREKRYNERFKCAEEGVAIALTAQEKATAAAFVAQEKAVAAAFASSTNAVNKAEEAQKSYNERSNEFRGQLDDQAKRLMPREETGALFTGINEKVDTNSTKMSALEKNMANYVNRVEYDALSIRLSSLETGAANVQGRIWSVTAIAWVVALGVSIALHFVH